MVVDVVGAPVTQASGVSGSTMAIVAASTSIEPLRRATPMRGMKKRLQYEIISASSTVSPELEKASTASSLVIMPISP